jgi:hypothetical protein
MEATMQPPVHGDWIGIKLELLVRTAPGDSRVEQAAYTRRWIQSAVTADKVKGVGRPLGAGGDSGSRGWRSFVSSPCASRRVAFQHPLESCFRHCVLNRIDRQVPRLAGNTALQAGLMKLEQPQEVEPGWVWVDWPPLPHALRRVSDFLDFCRKQTRVFAISASRMKRDGGNPDLWSANFLSFLFDPNRLIGGLSSRPYKEFADKPGFWASPAPLHPLQSMWAPQAVPRPYGGPTEHSDSTKRGNLAYGRLTQSEPTCPLEGQVGSGSGGEVPSRGA